MRSLFLLILLIPIFASAALVKATIKDSTGQIRTEVYDEKVRQKTRYFERNIKNNGFGWIGKLGTSSDVSLSSGAKATTTLPAVIEHQVEKKAIMRGLLSNTRIGGRFLAKSPWTYLAFTLVADKLIDEANDQIFKWDAAVGDFVTADDYVAIFTLNNLEAKRIGISKANMNTGVSTYLGRIQSGCEGLSTKVSEYYNDTYDFKSMTVQGSRGFTCLYVQPKTNVAKYVYINVTENQVRPITQDEFDNIMIPIADGSPSEYVNASRPSQDEDPPSLAYVDTVLQAGGQVQTDPYTDPYDGKAKQATITINQDGKSATIGITLRPDLQGDTDSAPVPKDPEVDTETKPETSTASVPVQCDKYPDTLGCEKMGDGSEAESIFSDIKIPEITNPAEFKLDNFLPDNGSCPAPKTYSTSHGSIIYSYEKHCDVARTLRPFLIAFASVTALYLIFFRKA